MNVTRKQLVEAARAFCGCAYAHQGRSRKTGLDCGGLLLVVGQNLGLTELEELGYATFPTGGRFEQLLAQEAIPLDWESTYPHDFDGGELLPGDLLAFDYRNGEGVRHSAIVSKFDGKNYWIIHAIPNYGVIECPLRHPYSKARLIGFRPKGLVD